MNKFVILVSYNENKYVFFLFKNLLNWLQCRKIIILNIINLNILNILYICIYILSLFLLLRIRIKFFNKVIKYFQKDKRENMFDIYIFCYIKLYYNF